MTAGNWFWIIYVIILLLGGWQGYRAENRPYVGYGLAIFILVGLVGWAEFGPPLH